MSQHINITPTEIASLLADYDIGAYRHSDVLTGGNVQSNYLVETETGKYVLKIYNRSYDSVNFEANTLIYILKRDFPCAAPIRLRDKSKVGVYKEAPFVFFEYIDGKHIENLSSEQRQQVIKAAATLQAYTKNYVPANRHARMNYSRELLQQLLTQYADATVDPAFESKRAWYQAQLDSIIMDTKISKAICHCDFDASNILWDGDELRALIDFDDANLTLALFDLTFLVRQWAFDGAGQLDMAMLKEIVDCYNETRKLNTIDKKHLYGVQRLQILMDSIWFYADGDPEDFPAKHDMTALLDIGHEAFTHYLFGDGYSRS